MGDIQILLAALFVSAAVLNSVANWLDVPYPIPLVLGGLAIGLIETFWSAYFSVEYKDVAAFSILIVVLIFMPTGLLGRPEVEKV